MHVVCGMLILCCLYVCVLPNDCSHPSLSLPPPPFSLQKEAIAWGWDLLTNVYKLPKDRLYVTYFEGNAELNLPPDEESRDIWLSMGWAAGARACVCVCCVCVCVCMSARTRVCV